jgi:Zn-dependent protease with chaperone function
MNAEDFETLVSKLEERAHSRPDVVGREMLDLLVLGYGYIALMLTLTAGATLLVAAIVAKTGGIALWWKVIVALTVMVGIILKSLWVEIPPPGGRALEPSEAPELWRRVREIAGALRAPVPRRILLTEDYNASVTQVPRLGIFGFPESYLTLGVPLLHALTPQQADAVLAHEFGHLSASHPKRGLWLYRIGQTWNALQKEMEKNQSAGLILFGSFFAWFLPRLHAYAFVMSRRDEYAADADSARVTSPETAGSALVAMAANFRVATHEVWERIWARAGDEPMPPSESCSTLPALLRERAQRPDLLEHLNVLLAQRASHTDTHPALFDRLRALGVVPDDRAAAGESAARLYAPGRHSAAEHYLGDVAMTFLRESDRAWQERNAEQWRTQHHDIVRTRHEIAALQSRDASLDLPQMLRLMELHLALWDEAAACAVAERILAEHPDAAEAHFVRGRHLLLRGDARGGQWRWTSARPPTACSCSRRSSPTSGTLRAATLRWRASRPSTRCSAKRRPSVRRRRCTMPTTGRSSPRRCSRAFAPPFGGRHPSAPLSSHGR